MASPLIAQYRGLVVFEDTKSGVRCEVEVDPPRPGNAFSRTFRRGTLQDIDTWHQDMLVGSIKVADHRKQLVCAQQSDRQ